MAVEFIPPWPSFFHRISRKKHNSMSHLIISSGGTGGHFYPGLSIAREFVSRGGKVTFLVSGQQCAEQKATAEKFGLSACEIPSVRAPRTPIEMLLFPFRFWKCCRAIKSLYRKLNADAMLSMGSFTSVAPCWTWPADKPLILHEGNTFMGQANRLFAKKASAIALTLPLKYSEQLKKTPARITGMPLREAILEAAANPPDDIQRQELHKAFGLSSEKRTLLVFGGSQGARAIISLVTETMPLIDNLHDKLQFIILTGADDNSELEKACADAKFAARIVKKDPDIQKCYQAADCVLCRAGASSICELALFRKPAMLMPLPTAKDNHQFFNAKCLQDANAARLLVQSETTPETLADVIREWLSKTSEWNERAKNLAQFARDNSTKDAVDLIQEVLKEK